MVLVADWIALAVLEPNDCIKDDVVSLDDVLFNNLKPDSDKSFFKSDDRTYLIEKKLAMIKALDNARYWTLVSLERVSVLGSSYYSCSDDSIFYSNHTALMGFNLMEKIKASVGDKIIIKTV